MAVEHRAVTFGRNGDVAAAQGRRVRRPARRRRTRPRWSGGPGGASAPGRCQSLPPTGIAAASQASHQDSGSGPARVEPAPVPDLEQRRAAAHRAGPADRPGERVVDRQQAARPPRWRPASRPARAGSRSSRRRRARPACPPSVVTSWPGSRVIPYRRAAAGQLGVVADRVVVGDREEVQPALRPPGRPARGRSARRPSARCACAGHRPASGGPAGPAGPGAAAGPRAPAVRARRRRRQRPGRRRGLRRHPVGHAVRRDAVHADHHLPRPGLELARQVAGRGRARR